MNTVLALPRFWTAVSVVKRQISAALTDRVVVALLAGLVILAIVDMGQAWNSLDFALRSLAGILPFLLVAVSLAALSRATGADRLIAGAFAGRPARSISIAAVAGALSPFCSCGVVPVIAGLLRARVPLAPVMAFWIASPVMDPEMFVLTAAGVSPEFAVAKTAATILMGLLSGYAVHLFASSKTFAVPLREDQAAGCSTGLPQGPVAWRFWRSSERRQSFLDEFRVSALFLGKWLLLAFFLESLMNAYLPSELVVRLLGSGAWYEIPLAAAVGIPAYLNGYAAIPLVAGLIEMGMNPGAAMAFMTAGAVSSIPAAMAVAVLVRRPVFAAYLLLGFTGSVLTGVLYSLFG